MVPVCEQQVTQINVIVRSRRAIYQYTTKHSVPCLNVEMRMIPRGPVLGRAPLVGEAVPGGNWTLGDAWYSIVVVGPVLSDAVEVNRSSVVLKCIDYVHDLFASSSVPCVFALVIVEILTDPVAPISDNGWTRKGSIDGHYGDFNTVWRGSAIFNIEPVLSSDTCVGH